MEHTGMKRTKLDKLLESLITMGRVARSGRGVKKDAHVWKSL